jgi:hypothetical protein
MKNRISLAKSAAVKNPAPVKKSRGLWGLLGKLPSGLAEIILLFLVSRGVLTMVGVLSVSIIARRKGGRLEWDYPSQSWLDIWGQWDTGWYLDIAKNWYAAEAHYQDYCNYAFFPFYPTLIKLLGAVLGNHYYAGLIISNVSLLGAAILLYKLVELDHDQEVALRSAKYMFIWPTSFVLSGVLSESLFLVLVIGCFYWARKGKWLTAGIAGFFLSLTRVPGVYVAIPLLYEYLKAKNFRLKGIRVDILSLALLPLGLSVFCVYNYYLTGDFLAFVHIQQSAWGHHFDNPIKTLVQGMFLSEGKPRVAVAAWFTGLTMASLAIFHRKVPLSYLLFCFISLFLPLIKGLGSMPRYTVVLFPVFILFAQLGKDRKVDAALTIFLSVLQGCLMIFWSVGDTLIM